MNIQLNHTIVWSSDKTKSANFLAEILGRPAPERFGHFLVVELDNGMSLDFADHDAPIQQQHYAFLISEDDFDVIFARIREKTFHATKGLVPPKGDRGIRLGVSSGI